MADIRDFFSYKKNREEEADTGAVIPEEPSYEDKIRRHRVHVFLRTIAAIAIIAGLAVVVYLSWRNKSYTEARVTHHAVITQTTAAEYIGLDTKVLQYSRDGASCIDENGTVIWNQTYQMQNPFTATNGTTVAIGDYNGRVIHVADTSGILGRIDTNLPIRDFCVSSQGVVAVVLDDVDVTWIHLYDSKGEQLAGFRTTMTGSGYPVSVAISPDGTMVGVSFLGEEEGVLKDTVAFYNFGSVGQNKTDNYVGGYNYPGVVVPLIRFLNVDSSFAVSDDRIMFYKGREVPAMQAENLTGEEEIRSVFYNDTYVAVVFSNVTGEGAYRLQLYNTNGQMVMTKHFSLAYTDVLLSDGQIVIYNDTEWQLVDLQGNDKYHGVFEDKIITLIPTAARDRFVAVVPGEVQTIELR